ncbi:50S ribosomal protein bL37 [Mycobacterium terramassiliense]
MSKRADKKRARRYKNANHGKRPNSGKRLRVPKLATSRR